MAIPLIAWGFFAIGVAGGGVVGALARQPEINRLQEQIKVLQGEAKKLYRLVDEQNRQIDVLKTKYDVMGGMNQIERAKAVGQLKGAIMFTYCLKEYLDIKYRFFNNPSGLSEEESQFVACFSKELSGSTSLESDRKVTRYYFRMYIREKYADQIDKLVECDLSQSFRKIGELAC